MGECEGDGPGGRAHDGGVVELGGVACVGRCPLPCLCGAMSVDILLATAWAQVDIAAGKKRKCRLL